MLYAAIHREKDWPDGFEEIAWLTKQLKNHGYTVNIEAKMFALRDGVDHRVTIIRWDRIPGVLLPPTRVEIGTYEDKDEAATMIRFLIDIENEKRNERT